MLTHASCSGKMFCNGVSLARCFLAEVSSVQACCAKQALQSICLSAICKFELFPLMNNSACTRLRNAGCTLHLQQLQSGRLQTSMTLSVNFEAERISQLAVDSNTVPEHEKVSTTQAALGTVLGPATS